jgi:uncharacterized protein (TIGR03437 family)
MPPKSFLAIVLLAVVATAAAAQSREANRITIPIDTSRLVTLPGHIRTLESSYVDEGAVEPSRNMDGMMLFLKPSAGQQRALNQLLYDLQDPASGRYHQWLTPEQYADQFGVSSSDAGKIAGWLESQGFQVGWIGRGRSVIAVNGTAGAVEAAFHTEIHRYRSGATVHYANAQNPSVPEVLRDVIGAIGGLNDFLPQSDLPARPAYNSGGMHNLGPGDLATIYDFASLKASGIDGTGQKLVVVGASSVQLTDLQKYSVLFGTPTPNVTPMIVPGFQDPGRTGAAGEGTLDLEVSGGAAPKAAILYVYSVNPYNAVTYAVDQNLAPVINASYHIGCDASVPTSELSSYQGIAQQGITEGITWVNSSGDIGAAGCDNNGEARVSKGLAARFPADIPEVTAVGGTEFNEQNGNFWATTNGAFGGSALSYIPEVVWNDSSPAEIEASTGGMSTFFAKPAWQTGTGVPNDGHRDIPDVAVAGSVQHDGYLIVLNGAETVTGGSSASAPLFSGMVVLLNQYLVSNGAQAQPGVGNLNVLLYRIAQSNPEAFHDIISGNNIVACEVGSPNCPSGTLGYTAGPGYDLCTGLGSLDLAKLAAAAYTKPVPTTAVSEVANGASFANSQVAAGSLITIFGTFPGATTASPTGLPLPDSLGNVSVTINGEAAPLNFVNATQVNLQVPWNVAPGPATAIVTSGGVASAPFKFTIGNAGPGIFVYGANHAVAQNSNYTTNETGSGEKVGGFVIAYMTGAGAVDNAIPTGAASPVSPVSSATGHASATIGGKTADILFLGMAPYFVGIAQADVKIPSLSSGDYPLVITVDGEKSNAPLVSVLGN